MMETSFDYIFNVNIDNERLNYYINLLLIKKLANSDKSKINKEKKKTISKL